MPNSSSAALTISVNRVSFNIHYLKYGISNEIEQEPEDNESDNTPRTIMKVSEAIQQNSGIISVRGMIVGVSIV